MSTSRLFRCLFLVALISFLGIGLFAILRPRHRSYGSIGGDVADVAGVSTPSIRSAIETRLDSAAPAGVSPRAWKRVHVLYESFDGGPLWVQDHVIGKRVRTLM